ncbi:hypothetical protein C8R46DRAFT_1354130 [Mycena filopes]|nr:hypothetical protein C8R46DRAFT_1354130 [Mycena filopes]
MHRCWKVDELTTMIFTSLGPIEDGITGVDSPQFALTRLARTCRDFTNPALDLLWKEQYGLVNLLQRLPAHTWVVTMQTALRPEDWDRVLSYSTRIKVLHQSPFDLSLHTSVLESVGMTFPRECILPNLRRLRMDSAPILLPYLYLLLGPQLQNITLELDGPVWRLGVLQLLRTKSPFLKDIFLWQAGSIFLSDETDAVSSFVAKLPQLRRLRVYSLNTQAYRALAALPHLEHIDVRVVDTIPFPDVDPPSPMAHFPALRSFILGASTGEDCNWSGPGYAPVASALLSGIRAHCSPFSLTSIVIDFAYERDTSTANPHLYTMAPHTLRPLLSCPKIQALNLISAFGFCLDNPFVDEMARAWPSIRRLHISGY